MHNDDIVQENRIVADGLKRYIVRLMNRQEHVCSSELSCALVGLSGIKQNTTANSEWLL